MYKANISIITTKSVLFRPWNSLALNSNHAFARYIVHVGLCNMFIIFIFTHLFCSYIVSTVLNEVSLVRYVQLIGGTPNLGPLLKTRTVEVGFWGVYLWAPIVWSEVNELRLVFVYECHYFNNVSLHSYNARLNIMCPWTFKSVLCYKNQLSMATQKNIKLNQSI